MYVELIIAFKTKMSLKIPLTSSICDSSHQIPIDHQELLLQKPIHQIYKPLFWNEQRQLHGNIDPVAYLLHQLNPLLPKIMYIHVNETELLYSNILLPKIYSIDGAMHFNKHS